MSVPHPQLDGDARFLVDLVSTPSISGRERAAAELFVDRARAWGFDADIDEATNAVAHRGPADAAIHVVLLGHIDTVAGDIPVRIEDGVLHGRGSVDAKGPLAAMLAAARRADMPAGVRLTVAGAAGEETPMSPGARHLVDRWRPDACIIGEPSGWDGVTLGYKGRLLAAATATCPHHHSAGRDPSAADLAFAWWRGVLGYADAFNADCGRVFDGIQASMQDMHSDCDGLTQRASIDAGFRLPVGVEPAVLAEQLRAMAPAGVQIECRGMERAHATDRSDPVVRALTSAIRTNGGRPRPKLKTGTADLNVVGPAWRCPIAAYGPGDSTLDHTPDERLPLDEFGRSIDVLADAIASLIDELCAADPATASGVPQRVG
ncbi:MAG: [LysW]-lysine hydrolase [Planctomycetota bacterium]